MVFKQISKPALASILALAGFLRLYQLGTQPLWCDESYFWIMATHDGWFKTLLHTIVDDVYPPLYFLILHGINYFSVDVFVLRLPGAIAGIAAAGAVYLFLKRWASPRAALYGGILAACSPVLIYYAQEMKMYALLSLWLWLLAVETWECLNDPQRGWKRLAFWALLSVYTFYLAVVVWIVLAGLVLLFVRGRWRSSLNVWKGFAVATLGFLPWLPFFLKGVVVGRPGVNNALLDRVFLFSFQNFSVGFWSPDSILYLGLAAFALPTFWGLVRAQGSERRLNGFLVGLAFLPLALLWIPSILGKPLYTDRAMLVCALAWTTLTALGLARLPRALGALGLGICLTLQFFALDRYHNDTSSRRTDLRPAWAHVVSQWQAGDGIFHVSATETYYPFKFYALQEARQTAAPARLNWIWAPAMDFNPSEAAGRVRQVWRRINAWLTARGLGIYAGYNRDHVDGERLEKEALPGLQRIWFLNATPEAAARLWQPQMNAFRSGMNSWKPLEPEKMAWLKGRFDQVSRQRVGEVDVYLFEAKPQPERKGRP